MSELHVKTYSAKMSNGAQMPSTAAAQADTVQTLPVNSDIKVLGNMFQLMSNGQDLCIEEGEGRGQEEGGIADQWG